MAKVEVPSNAMWVEPASDYKAQYPYNQVMQSESGHFLEFDDTLDAERVRLQHRTGTFTELQSDGSRITKIVGDNYEIIAKDNNVLISGICNITVQGNSYLTVNGDCVQRISGDFLQEVEGNYQQVVKGDISISGANDIDINAGSTLGSVNITAPMVIQLNSDVEIDGGVAAESVLSRGEVTAGTGIHAGVLGSVNPMAGISTLGGVSAGFPAAPGPGIITGLVLAQAPLVQGIVVQDILGSMMLMRLQYDLHTHIHVGLFGITSMPLILM